MKLLMNASKAWLQAIGFALMLCSIFGMIACDGGSDFSGDTDKRNFEADLEENEDPTPPDPADQEGDDTDSGDDEDEGSNGGVSSDNEPVKTSSSGDPDVESPDTIDPLDETEIVPSDAPEPITPECQEASKTAAKLLTKTIKNGTPNQFLHYSISVESCDGSPYLIDGQPILFDVDAFLEGEITNYEIIIAGKSYPGTAETVNGSDLFNKTGPQYRHSRTKAIVQGAKATTIEIKIDVSNLVLTPIAGGNLLDTYIRIGQTETVQASVTVDNSNLPGGTFPDPNAGAGNPNDPFGGIFGR